MRIVICLSILLCCSFLHAGRYLVEGEIKHRNKPVILWKESSAKYKEITVGRHKIKLGLAEKQQQMPKLSDEDILNLAKSCIGEAGFSNFEECVSIMYVYHSRSQKSGVSISKMVKEYSAPLKVAEKRTWIKNLNMAMARPKGWPNRLRWSTHKAWWQGIIETIKLWETGVLANPTEHADHFGGSMDAPPRKWIKVVPVSFVRFGNTFYASEAPQNSSPAENKI